MFVLLHDVAYIVRVNSTGPEKLVARGKYIFIPKISQMPFISMQNHFQSQFQNFPVNTYNPRCEAGCAWLIPCYG